MVLVRFVVPRGEPTRELWLVIMAGTWLLVIMVNIKLVIMVNYGW